MQSLRSNCVIRMCIASYLPPIEKHLHAFVIPLNKLICRHSKLFDVYAANSFILIRDTSIQVTTREIRISICFQFGKETIHIKLMSNFLGCSAFLIFQVEIETYNSIFIDKMS